MGEGRGHAIRSNTTGCGWFSEFAFVTFRRSAR
jgi:hypothetical protein